MGTTGIEWTDVTWNPMTGCTKISAGCDNCYAAVVAANRTRLVYLDRDPVRDTPANRQDPFAPRFWEERLELPLSWRTPRRVFEFLAQLGVTARWYAAVQRLPATHRSR